MPAIRHNNHGQPLGGGPLGIVLSKDFITDQTYKDMESALGSANWAFDADEGFGVNAGLAGSTVWAVTGGGSQDLRVTAEIKHMGFAAAGSHGIIGRMPTYIAADRSYYWLRIWENDSLRLSKTNGGTVNLDTQALTRALVQDEIFRLTYQVINNVTQDHSGVYSSQARTDNSPGAVNYDLAGIAAGADTTIRVTLNRGPTPQVITFTAGDFVNYAACTNAEISTVINAQLVGGRSWAVGNIIYVAVAEFGLNRQVDVQAGLVNDANTVLSIAMGDYSGEDQTVSGSDSILGTSGFVGFRGGFTANTGHWFRSMTVEYI